MGFFSKKKGDVKDKPEPVSSSIYEWNRNEDNKIPRILPDTLMQRLSVSQNSDKDMVVPQKIFTDDIKAILKMRSQVKDEYKKIPQDIHYESKNKGPDRHEIENVIMLKEAQMRKEEEVPIAAPEEDKKTKEEKKSEPKDAIQKEAHRSFFAELEKLFGHKHGVRHIISQDMMARMKEYHDAIGNGDSFFMHEMDIEKEIEQSLSSLKNMELDWLMSKKEVSSAEKTLFAKEEELEKKLDEFKSLLMLADRFRNFNVISPDGNSFLLSNGIRLHSIQHLINELPQMSDDVFYHHVNSERNDFALWIRDVFKLEDLALVINSAKTRQEILEMLKKY